MSTCIITGASSGIGRAAAIEVSKAREYDNIVLISRNQTDLEKTKEKMSNGVNVKVISFDLINIENISQLVEDIYLEFGEINCLVNIAGYTEPAFLFETSNDNIVKTFTINVYAPFVLCRECARYMKNNKEISKILNVGSTAGITPRPGWSVYSMSKAAIIQLSSTLTEELAPYGIHVYCLSPGRCATSLRRKLAPEEDQSKIMQPQTVGVEIARLISKRENCLDGQNIIIREK